MKKIIGLLFICVSAITAFAQNDISYTVSFPNIIHHEAEVIMSMSKVKAKTLTIRMSRSSPGRYATHEFGKNLYHFRAVDFQNNPLKFNQLSGDVYEIIAPSENVKITYTLFGNWVDGTYAGFDETHAHMNIPATFAYPIGMDELPRTVVLNFPIDFKWKVATQLKPLGNNKYYAPNLQYFMDSPIEISDYRTYSWEVKGKDGKNQTIHYVAHSNDTQQTVNDYGKMLEKMVQEQVAVWGEFPTYDYGSYHFLQDVYPTNAGDGMEHRNSTSIVERTEQIKGNELDLLGTFSHEYFHSWNVERLRPKSLEPFNFEHANMSGELWFAEGFTQYYGNLTLKRAGFRTLDEALQTFSGLVNAALNTPGAKNFSPIQASRYAVFADAGVAIDQTNKANIFTSYYSYGAATALALDLELRSKFNLTLDDYIRALWKTNGKTEIAYTEADLQKVLGSLTKNSSFAKDFFTNTIFGTKKGDYAKLLNNAGLVLRKANANKAYTGFGRMYADKDGVKLPQTLQGTPAYLAGLDVDDLLLKIDGEQIITIATVEKIIAAHKSGDKISIIYSHRGIEKTTILTLVEDPFFEVVSMEQTGGILTSEMQTFRMNWLDSQVKN